MKTETRRFFEKFILLVLVALGVSFLWYLIFNYTTLIPENYGVLSFTVAWFIIVLIFLAIDFLVIKSTYNQLKQNKKQRVNEYVSLQKSPFVYLFLVFLALMIISYSYNKYYEGNSFWLVGILAGVVVVLFEIYAWVTREKRIRIASKNNFKKI